MLIIISGTPGTGKTAVAKLLARELNACLITTSYLVKKYKIKTALDKKRRTKIIDMKKLAAAVKKEAKNEKLIVFEGHLSHFVPADLTIILRTSPAELERRLKRKRWGRDKIRENVEAEAMGIISDEADGVEIDTTRKAPEKTAALIIKLLNNRRMRGKYMKKIDWMREYALYLLTSTKIYRHESEFDI